jgi:hypothetical protein
MKKLVLLVMVILTTFSIEDASAARRFRRGRNQTPIFKTGMKLEVTHKLSEDYVFEGGEHLNLGVMYDQFSFCGIPVWNYGETKWAYVNDAANTYDENVTDEELTALRESGLDIPKTPSISFWNRIGGKLVVIAGVFIGIFGWKVKRKKNAENESLDETE